MEPVRPHSPGMTEEDLRIAIVAACRHMNASGLNQGTSGNISVRCDNAMLITPSAVPYDQLTPDQIVKMPLTDSDAWEGPRKPSSEWRFHFDILNARPEIGAVVHTHATYCTALSMLRCDIPAAHYMVAAFGGNSVRCAPFAIFGTQALSDLAVAALRDRTACLLGNHGAIALGTDLNQAMWRAEELETLARQYSIARQLGEPVILSDEDIDMTLTRFRGYGLSDAD